MNPHPRLQVLMGSALFVLLGLAGRVYHLTVVRHDELLKQAERRRRRVEVLPARRGELLDRQGRPLAIDQHVQDVVLYLPEVDPSLNLVPRLARAFRCTRQTALQFLRRARRDALLDPGGEVLVGTIGIEDAELARRALGRRAGVRFEVAAAGIELYLASDLFHQRRETQDRLGQLLDRAPADLEELASRRVDEIHAEPDRYERIALWQQPLLVMQEAPFEVVARVSERAFELPGVRIAERFERRYPQGEVAVHVIGSLGAPTRRELRESREQILDGDPEALGFRLGSRTTIEDGFRLRNEPYGRSGAERSLNTQLRGVPGVRVVVRDSKNRDREVLLDLPPRDGREVRLTLHTELQAVLEGALDEAVAQHGDAQAGGAAVVIDLQQGDILALASSPRSDPNDRRVETYRALLEDPRRPLLHRGVMAFPPASTWKILSSLVATDPQNSRGLAAHWTTRCEGRLSSRSKRFRCDGVHGDTGLVRAIERSCNVFFFRAADHLARTANGRLDARQSVACLANWAERLGLGHPLVPDLGGEQRGVIPSPGYKRRRATRALSSLASWLKRLGEAVPQADPRQLATVDGRLRHADFWYRRYAQDVVIRPGDVRNAFIGQGDVLATPLQVAWLAALIATRGQPPRPRIHQGTPSEFSQFNLDQRVVGLLREGMRRCVTHGTASHSKIGLNRLEVAGKTGTAERRKGEAHLGWFMGYYPASRPQVAFAVLVDRTPGHGGEVCGPVARAVLECYRDLRKAGGL